MMRSALYSRGMRLDQANFGYSLTQKGLTAMSFGKFATALAIIVIGIYFFLESLHLISPEMIDNYNRLVPLLFLLLGLLMLVLPLLNKRRPQTFWGFLLVIYGGLLIADQTGRLVFHWNDFWKLWPYLIIYFGLSLLFGHHHSHSHQRIVYGDRPRYHQHSFAEAQPRGSMHWTGFDKCVSDVNFHNDNWMAQPMDERTRIGNYSFDFTKAFVPDETIPIHLSGWVGDVKITIPEDMAFQLHLKARFGDAKIGKNKQSGIIRDFSYKTPDYDTATRRLDFDFEFQVIDLRISQV